MRIESTVGTMMSLKRAVGGTRYASTVSSHARHRHDSRSNE
jgi:hypothetical protein